MAVMVIMLTTLVVVIGGSVWIWLALREKDDEGVVTVKVEPERKTGKKSAAGTALALIKPDRIESEVKLDAVVVQSPKHVVVRTWIGHSYGLDDYRWKCACGVSGDSVAQYMARDRAADHVRDGNAAEALKAKTNGRFSW